MFCHHLHNKKGPVMRNDCSTPSENGTSAFSMHAVCWQCYWPQSTLHIPMFCSNFVQSHQSSVITTVDITAKKQVHFSIHFPFAKDIPAPLRNMLQMNYIGIIRKHKNRLRGSHGIQKVLICMTCQKKQLNQQCVLQMIFKQTFISSSCPSLLQ